MEPIFDILLASIAFPAIDPVAFHVGPVAVRWYGIAYVLAFGVSYVALRAMVRRGTLRLTVDALDGLLAWLVAGVLVGGRLGWWLVYHRDVGRPEPWYEPLAAWHGGMSFHGGLVGVTLVILPWCWRNRAPLWNVADCAALVTPMGLFFGRLANFINAELVGRPTSVPWGVIFPGDAVARHPSQLYEAVLEGPVLLALLWGARRWVRGGDGRGGDGRVAALFVLFYGVIRFGVEFTREPDVQLGFIAFGWLTMGQLLSLATVLVGVLLLWWRTTGREKEQPLSDGPPAAGPAPKTGPVSET